MAKRRAKRKSHTQRTIKPHGSARPAPKPVSIAEGIARAWAFAAEKERSKPATPTSTRHRRTERTKPRERLPSPPRVPKGIPVLPTVSEQEHERIRKQSEEQIRELFTKAVRAKPTAEKKAHIEAALIKGRMVSADDVAILFQDALLRERAERQARIKRIAELRERELSPYEKRKARGRIFGLSKERAAGHRREGEAKLRPKLPQIRGRMQPRFNRTHGEREYRRNLRDELLDEYGSPEAIAVYFQSIGLTAREAWTLWYSP